MNDKIKLTILSICILVIGSFIFLSPLRHKVISMLSNFSRNQTASVGDIFSDSFASDASIEEAGSIDESSDRNWWVNSGAYLYPTEGVLGTLQGDLAEADPWNPIYASSNESDSDKGVHPQNIFRLVNRNTWQNFRQEAYFKITAINLSDSPNRNASNGLLLFNRYVDSDNLYYAGVRVDGDMVIKKKISGEYHTMSSANLFEGDYDISGNPNLITENTWIGLRTEVVTLPSGNVLISLYTDVGMTGTWTLGVQVQDDGASYGGASITDGGYSGIRTDFMDVLFSGYSIEEFDPLLLTPESELPEEGTIIFHYDSSLSNAEDVASISSGISFSIAGESTYVNDETATLSPGEYVVSVSFEEREFTFGEECVDGNITLVDDAEINCNVTEIVEEVVEEEEVVSSGGGGSGGGGGGIEIDSSINESLPEEEAEETDSNSNLFFIPSEENIEKNEEPIQKENTEQINNFSDIKEEVLEKIEKKLDTLEKTELTTKSGKTFYTLDPADVIEAINEPVTTSNLSYGLRDSSEVKMLQAFLAQEGDVYPEALVTGFFGPLTESAVKKFQIKYGVISIIDPFKFGYGKVGPNTVQKINEVYSSKLKKENVLFNYVRE